MICNKVSYKTKRDAVLDAKSIGKSARHYKEIKCNPNKKLNPYLCVKCSNWHLTSLSKGERRRISETQRKIGLIKSIIRNNALSYLLGVSESWMELTSTKNKMRVRFKGFDSYGYVTILNK